MIFFLFIWAADSVTITTGYLALGTSKKNLVLSNLIQVGWTRDVSVGQTFLHKTAKSFLLLTNQLWPFRVDILLLPQYHTQKKTTLQSREMKAVNCAFFSEHISADDGLTFPNHRGPRLLCALSAGAMWKYVCLCSEGPRTAMAILLKVNMHIMLS